MVKDNKVAMILLAIVLLVIVGGPRFQFILYGGSEINAELTTIKKDCFTLGQEQCVRQSVFMLNLTDTGLLICPEGYYSTIVECKRIFGLTKEPEVKIDCYYAGDDVCILEQFEEQCPSQYYISKQLCEASLVDLAFSFKKLFSNRKTLILLAVGGVAFAIMLLNSLRRG